MNATLAKVENTLPDEPGGAPLIRAAAELRDSPPANDASLDENAERTIYRRSVAYFFFGSGCNRNVILTDEP